MASALSHAYQWHTLQINLKQASKIFMELYGFMKIKRNLIILIVL